MSHDPRFDELAMAYLTGGITAADMEDFERRLKADPAARSRLAELSEQELALRHIFVHAENRRRFASHADTAIAESRRASKSRLPRLRRTRAARGQRVRGGSTLWIPLTAAAGLLLCLLLFVANRPSTDSGRVAVASKDPVRPGTDTDGRWPEEKARPAPKRPVGNIVYVAEEGAASREMRIRRHDGDREERLPLVEGMPLLAGDRIETGPREPDVEEQRPVRAAVELAGTTIDLADGTQVETVSEEELRVDRGLLYAVASSERPAPALTVRTPHAEVRAERATMDVSVASGGTALRVEKGSASMQNAQGAVQVQALQKSVARAEQAPTPAVAIYASAFWRGRLGPAATAPVEVEPAVLGFTLIDADRDEPIAGFDPLPPGEVVLNLAQLPTRRLNIRANTEPESGISVRFDIDSRLRHKLEQIAPYAFNGDTDSDYEPWTPTPGTYVITATPFADLTGHGKPGKALRVTIRVQDR